MEHQDLNRHFKDIVDAVKDGIMMVDTDGRIVMVNAAMSRMTAARLHSLRLPDIRASK